MIDHHKIKAAYSQPEGKVYFNTSSTGLISRKSMEAADLFNQGLHEFGGSHAERFKDEALPVIREDICKFIDADIDELALIPNFSHGLCAILPALTELKRMLLFSDDYPSLTQPFINHGFDIHWLESDDGFFMDLEGIKQLVLEHRIQILAISHVQYLSGFIVDLMDLGGFCRQNNVLLIVDGTQSLGAVPFSFKSSNVDIYIASNYKWMNAGFGTGILCMRQEILKKYPPKSGGFHSYKMLNDSWKYVPSIHSYEPGHLNMPGLAMLHEAVKFKMEIGVEQIAKHNSYLMNMLLNELKPTSHEIVGEATAENRAGIVSIKGDEKLFQHLSDHGFVAKFRQNTIRIGIHFYNTEEDVDRLVSCLGQ